MVKHTGLFNIFILLIQKSYENDLDVFSFPVCPFQTLDVYQCQQREMYAVDNDCTRYGRQVKLEYCLSDLHQMLIRFLTLLVSTMLLFI